MITSKHTVWLDMELSSCADVVVRETEHSTYTVEVGEGVETLSETEMRSLVEALRRLGLHKGWLAQ